MSVSILAVDDETDVADLFRQHFRREVRQGQYGLHFVSSGDDALDNLAKGIEVLGGVTLRASRDPSRLNDPAAISMR